MDYEKVLDCIIKEYEYDIQSRFGIGLIIRKHTGFDNNKPLTPVYQSEILPELERLIVNYGYGKAEDKSREFYKISQTWKDAKKAGGHFAYQILLKENENEIRIDKELTRASLWYNHEGAKQKFIDYPIIKKQRNVAYYIAIISILLTIASTWIAFVQYIKCK